MNQYFFEFQAKQKIKDLQEEGIHSQAFQRSGAKARRILPRLPKLAAFILVILGFAAALIR